ncbi:MAG TPA: hypothetical protein VFE65_31750 [Pseudonocardia sp.]|nr:hypothetical protein [Pseudonocardia sp.]
MIRKMGRKTAVATAMLALGSAGSALLAGTALATPQTVGDAGNGGSGGKANANCGVPVGLSLGVIGQGGDVSQCNATGGAGGGGGTGVSY